MPASVVRRKREQKTDRRRNGGRRRQRNNERKAVEVSELVEGGDDGVVYLGRSGFKMKVGVKTTPAAGTPAAPSATPTIPPLLNTLAPVRRSSGSFQRRSAVLEEPAPLGARTRTMVVGGLCMIAFSLGVMCTIAVDRYWPGAHPQCGGVVEPTSTETVQSGSVTPGVEAAEMPAAVPAGGAVVAPLPPAD